MKILQNTFAVFWTRKEWRQQFHADLARLNNETARHAVQRYRAIFPQDIVCSVRASNGKFVSFR